MSYDKAKATARLLERVKEYTEIFDGDVKIVINDIEYIYQDGERLLSSVDCCPEY
jgi:hypothetical protein